MNHHLHNAIDKLREARSGPISRAYITSEEAAAILDEIVRLDQELFIAKCGPPASGWTREMTTFTSS